MSTKSNYKYCTARAVIMLSLAITMGLMGTITGMWTLYRTMMNRTSTRAKSQLVTVQFQSQLQFKYVQFK